MKFKCNKKELLKHLSVLTNIVEAKVIYNIESNIYMQLENNKLTLRSTNGSMSAQSSLIVESDNSQGSVLVYANKFYSIIKEMSNDDIIVEVEENEKINIMSENKKSKHLIVGLKSDDYPVMEYTGSNTFALTSNILKNLIAKSKEFVAREPFKPALRGVLFRKVGDSLIMVATDCRRMAVVEKVENVNCNDFEAIVEIDVLDSILSLIDDNIEVKIGISEKFIYFKINDFEFVSSLIEGKYPNYSQVIPNEFAYSFKVGKLELLAGIKRVAPMIKDIRSKRIILNVETDVLVLEGINTEMGNSKETLDIKYEGEPFKVAFNYEYLISAVKNVDSEIIEFNVNEGSSPTMINDVATKDYFTILMPMSISED